MNAVPTTKPLYKITNLWFPPKKGSYMVGNIYGHPNVGEGCLGHTSTIIKVHSESLIETENSVYIIEPEEAPSIESEGPVSQQK